MGMGCEHRPEDFLLTLVQLQNPTLNRGGWEQGNPYQRTGQDEEGHAGAEGRTGAGNRRRWKLHYWGLEAAKGPATEGNEGRTGAKRPHRDRQEAAPGPNSHTGAGRQSRTRPSLVEDAPSAERAKAEMYRGWSLYVFFFLSFFPFLPLTYLGRAGRQGTGQVRGEREVRQKETEGCGFVFVCYCAVIMVRGGSYLRHEHVTVRSHHRMQCRQT